MDTHRAVFFNRFVLSIPLECVEDCAHQGQCDDDVEWWTPRVMLAEPNAGISDDDIREELREYGAWEDEELSDTEENLRRILWIACCNIVEEV
jgi:hypothetical protein